MTIKEILQIKAHRPWDIPKKPWQFYQEWNKAIFLHWEVELSDLEKLVPKEIEIDLFDGKPWVSLVAFTMEKIRPRFLPSFPPISNFDEINIRTYVKMNGKTGVYFLSMEGGKKLSCAVAEGISELPYRFSKTERTENRYQSRNAEFNDNLDLEYTVGKQIQEKTHFDKWLTERYALFQETEKSINQFEIHHVEWPVKEISFNSCVIDYPRFKFLIKRKPDKMQYSDGVQVIAWGKHQNKRA